MPLTLSTFARLVRLPAALTAPGDSIAGAAAAGWPMGKRSVALPLSSVFTYWAGMALNDFADRKLDAVERPERPIPSGDVTAREAFVVAVVLSALGLGAAAFGGGRRALAVALPLAASAWSYDLYFKSTRWGPVSMALTRSLDVMLGACYGRVRSALPSAVIVGVHIFGTTILSRHEVHGSVDKTAGDIAVGATAGAALAALALPSGPPGSIGRRGHGAAIGTLLAAGFAAVVGGPQWAARRTGAAPDVRTAVGASVIGTIPLQGSLIARRGHPLLGAAVAFLWPVARWFTRKNSAT